VSDTADVGAFAAPLRLTGAALDTWTCGSIPAADENAPDQPTEVDATADADRRHTDEPEDAERTQRARSPEAAVS
jgi:hypothetical protein